jgi:hypothetical protein
VNPGTILSKTAKGRQEMQERSDVLSAVQRRLLILVDGQRTVNVLGAFFRVVELEGALAFLLKFGYIRAQGESAELIAPVAPGFAGTPPSQPSRPATSVRQFERVRSDASEFIRRRLGDAAAPICSAVERCDSLQELRRVLRGVEMFVGQRLDAHTAQSFARHFGAMLP